MSIKKNFVLRDLGEGNFVIVNTNETVDMSKMISTNETGALIFKGLSRGEVKEEIVSSILKNYDVCLETINKDYDIFIAKLKENSILE